MAPFFVSRQLYLYTFTFYHDIPPLDAWKNTSKAWNRFRTAATKKYGQFSYARILEHHKKSPYPHLHVIADKYFPPVWFAAELKSAGFGYQADVAPVTSPQASIYVTKYLTKPWTDEGCRTMRTNLRLRLISFGGTACLRKASGTPWELVYKSLLCKEVEEEIAIDRDWTYGNETTETYRKEFDAYAEVTYFFKGVGFTEEETQKMRDGIP
jgi:hypothetical protein